MKFGYPLKDAIMKAIDYYKHKLEFETDSADLFNLMQTAEIKNIVIVDTRIKDAYEKEHIVHAINLPNREVTDESLNHLDKNKLYVTYCSGVGCNGSTKGALKLAEAGFIVKELIGGITCWKEEGYETEGLQAFSPPANNCGC